MKKFLTLALSAASIAMIATACSSTNVSQYSAPLDVKVETAKAPVVEVGGEIKGTATIQRVLFFTWGVSKFADGVNYGAPNVGFSLLGTNEAGKAAAAYNATVTSNADVIVVPRYTVETDDYFVYAKSVYNVKGFKGTLKSVQK
jgi:hypothetical protein